MSNNNGPKNKNPENNNNNNNSDSDDEENDKNKRDEINNSKKNSEKKYKAPISDKNNNPFLDPSGNIFKNPLFTPLLNSKKKNLLLLKNVGENNNKTNSLETNKDKFNMTVDKIVNKIKENRSEDDNKKNIFFDIFKKSLDEKSKLTINNGNNTTDLNTFLNNVNNDFDKIHKSSNSFFNTKNNDYPKSNLSFRSNNSWRYNSGNRPAMRRPLLPPPPPPGFPSTIPKQPIIKKELVDIQVEITCLSDLLKLIDDYPLAIDKEYNINMAAIHKIDKPLRDLDKMIGMHSLKNSIVDQILYFVQNLHKDQCNKNGDFMHTCIYGPPGTGKTEVAKIMGKIFSKLGILSKNKFKKVTRADLIAGYLGQTALKTQEVVKECIGGVLFIDEAYALGNSEKRDSFAKECIDTLCEALSDNKDNLMVIIAGYEKELKNCFFAYNQGLDSRFTWRFKTDDYKDSELNLIFQKKIAEANWKIKEQLPDSWFTSKMDYFKYYGRDMETLFAKTKIAHSRRVFCLPKKEKKQLTKRDFDKGFELYIANEEVKSRKNDPIKSVLNHMYL